MSQLPSPGTLSTSLLKATNLGYPFPPGLNAGHNISSLPRLFWVLLLAAALAALACWTLPAFADSGDATWSARLVPYGTAAKGCWSTSSIAACSHNLYPNTFVYGGETYEIDRVVLTTRELMYLRLNSTIAGAQSATLVVGGASLQFDPSATKSPRWYDTGIDWSDADTISLSLWMGKQPVASDPAPVLVNAPPAGADRTITLRTNTTYAFGASDFGFSDPDRGDSLKKVQITALQSAGSLKLSGTQVALNQEVPYHDMTYLVFEPAPDATGSPYATFQFKVSDGETYSSRANTITINVTPANAPPAGADRTITAYANTEYKFIPSDFGFSDPDAGDSLREVRITALQSAGSLKLGPANLARVPCDGPWGACVQNVTRTQVAPNQEIRAAQIAGLVFVPAQNATGSPYATFQFKVSDGISYSSQANTITINVLPVESAPPDVNPLQPATERTATSLVVDTTPPVITLTGPATLTMEVDTAYAEPGYTATDDQDGDLTGSVVVTGIPARENSIRTLTIYYDVRDSSGNAAVQKTRTVHVVDTTPPVIRLAGASVEIPVGTVYVEPGYTATDNHDYDLTGSVVVTGTLDVASAGTYTLYYGVTDSSGNAAAQQTRTVTVTGPVSSDPNPEAGPGNVVSLYDTNGDDAIDQQEWMRAVEDYENGLLTGADIYTISQARS